MESKSSKYLFFWLPYDVKYTYETFLTAFYLSIKRFPSASCVHLGHQKIFENIPSHLPDNWLQAFHTAMPNNEELSALNKIIWNSDIFQQLEDEHKSKNLVWEYLLTKEYQPLMDYFETELIKLLEQTKIKGIVLWSNCPSIKKIAQKYKIPVIHNEMGPLREPTYLPTCYFDFSGVNGETESASRFTKYTQSENESYNDLSRLALVSLFSKVVKPIREFNKYQVGLPLQVEDDSNIIAFSNGFDNSELINYAKNKTDSILVRKHPYGRVDYDDIITGSSELSPQEFISLCEYIITINSSVGLEAMLLGKPAELLGDSPFNFIDQKNEDFIKQLRFGLLNYLVPFDFLFNEEYYDWRSTMPHENSIREKHILYYLKQKHGWDKNNFDFRMLNTELENIWFRNLNLQFVEKERDLLNEIRVVKSDYEEFSAKLQEAELKVKDLNAELVRNQLVLEQVFASKSWKITKPLRLMNVAKTKIKNLKTIKSLIYKVGIKIAKKVLSNYHVRQSTVKIAKKIGLYGKLKAIYLRGQTTERPSIVHVTSDKDVSRDAVINIKKIKILKKQRGKD